MPPKKRRKLTKRELFEQRKKKGRRGSIARGEGVGSRQQFVLPVNWETEVVQDVSGHKKFHYRSPGKTVYRTQGSVQGELLNRGFEDCLLNPPSSSSDVDTDKSDPDFKPDDEPKLQDSCVVSVDVEPRLFVCESSQIVDFVEQINKTSKCATSNCEGKRPLITPEIFLFVLFSWRLRCSLSVS